MAVKTWNTAPDYDEWGVDEFWSCEDWIQWHRLLLEKFDKQKAKILWEYAYAKSGGLSSNLDCRTFNSTFRNYARTNGLDTYGNAGIFAPVLQGYGTLADVSSGILGGVGSFFTTKTTKTILTIVAIGAVAFGGMYAYKTFKK